jgi:hypothetical protein
LDLGDPPTHASVYRGAVGINLTLEPSDAGSGGAYAISYAWIFDAMALVPR